MAGEPDARARSGARRGQTALIPDTIVAVATPAGRGGVGIVRVSGMALDRLIETIVGKPLVPRVATFTTFRDADGATIDEGLALHFPAPASYTGEHVLELHAHGSPVALRLLVGRCIDLGARLAEPGEFTKRAFLNGKLDLAQAESVADLIDAATATAAKAAARSLTGEFSTRVHALVDAVTTLQMFTEATLDFPDEDIEFLQSADAAGRLTRIREDLDVLLARAAAGARLAQGLSVVLVGRPNVGKSSLLNRLVREDAAIVTPIAGTTRDTVARQVEIAGIPLNVVDTAGLHETGDAIEQMGIERTLAAIARADVAVVIVDARIGALAKEDIALLDRLPANLPRLVVQNKADLAKVPTQVRNRDGVTHVWASALTGEGIELVEASVLTALHVATAGEDAFIARERHLVALRAARTHLAVAADQLGARSPALELFAEELRGAQQALSTITGEFTADDLLGVIFSRFCIGK